MSSIRPTFAGVLVAAAWALAGCSDPVSTQRTQSLEPDYGKVSATTIVSVTGANPWNIHRGTTADVTLSGSGFDNGSQASFALHGVPTDRIKVNSTRYISTTELVANVTVADDAPLDSYDAVVVTLAGKKGIGTEAVVIGIDPEVLTAGGRPQDVNASAFEVGGISGGCSSVVPTVWNPDASTTMLPLGNYCSGNALAITADGVILASMSGGASGARVIFTPQTAGYTSAEIAPAPDGTRPYTGSGMNDSQQIIGWAPSPARIYWWSPSTGWLPVRLPANATSCQTLSAINNRGEFAAKCTIGKTTVNGYYWPNQSSAPVLLPMPSGAAGVTPYDINDSGVIVGYTAGNKAVRWSPTVNGYTVETLADKGFGAVALSIATDGTISGSIFLDSKGTRAPVVWLVGGGYRVLSISARAAWGEGSRIAQTSTGYVVAGYDNLSALRWFLQAQ